MAVGAELGASNHFRFRCRCPGRWRGGPLDGRDVSGGNAPCCACVLVSSGSGPAELQSRDCYRPGTDPPANGGELCWLLRKREAARWQPRAEGTRAPVGRPGTRGGGRRGTGMVSTCTRTLSFDMKENGKEERNTVGGSCYLKMGVIMKASL